MFPGKDTKEQRLHSTAYISYSFYECRLPTSFLTVPMHWHSEFELDYVVRGSGEFLCGGERIRANEGGRCWCRPTVSMGPAPAGNKSYFTTRWFSAPPCWG